MITKIIADKLYTVEEVQLIIGIDETGILSSIDEDGLEYEMIDKIIYFKGSELLRVFYEDEELQDDRP